MILNSDFTYLRILAYIKELGKELTSLLAVLQRQQERLDADICFH